MIKINPDFFSSSKKKTRRKRRDGPKQLRQSIKPNNIKKKLMARIKEHQQRKQNNLVEKSEEKDFKEDFNAQLSYLEKAINKEPKKKKKRAHRNTKHKLHRPSSQQTVEPPYGCLKNGKKPTYSQYRRTLKKKSLIIENTEKPMETPPAIRERQNKLRQLKKKLAPRSKPKLVRTKKTIKIFKLGKDTTKAEVGVLIKSSMTRKVVQNEQKILRKKCLVEIKQYLRKHNLIKVGSSAPEDVLRKIYEDSFLAGNIYNKNPANLLYNYLNDDDSDSFFK